METAWHFFIWFSKGFSLIVILAAIGTLVKDLHSYVTYCLLYLHTPIREGSLLTKEIKEIGDKCRKEVQSALQAMFIIILYAYWAWHA